MTQILHKSKSNFQYLIFSFKKITTLNVHIQNNFESIEMQLPQLSDFLLFLSASFIQKLFDLRHVIQRACETQIAAFN